jgi:hypothetical protein
MTSQALSARPYIEAVLAEMTNTLAAQEREVTTKQRTIEEAELRAGHAAEARTSAAASLANAELKLSETKAQAIEVGPGAYCPPRHQTHFETSFLEKHSTL